MRIRLNEYQLCEIKHALYEYFSLDGYFEPTEEEKLVYEKISSALDKERDWVLGEE